MAQDQIIHNALVNTGLDLVILGIAFAISFYISVRAQSGFFKSLLAVLTGWIFAAIMGLALMAGGLRCGVMKEIQMLTSSTR